MADSLSPARASRNFCGVKTSHGCNLSISVTGKRRRRSFSKVVHIRGLGVTTLTCACALRLNDPPSHPWPGSCEGMSATKRNVVTLTAAEETELARIDVDGDGTISAEEARAAAKSSAELRASNSRLWKVVFGVFALLFLSWLGNAGLMVAVVTLSKDLKVEGGSLKNNKDGGAISTVSQKKVYEVTLPPSRRQLDEQHSDGTNESSTVVAQVPCASVLGAISSIEQGNDGSLVKLNLGDGEFWEPRMSAASYHLHESSFGIEQIYLDDQRDVSYDVTCEIPKADCENAPGSLCDAVMSSEVIFSDDNRRALSFEDAFDGEIKVRRRRLKKCVKSVDDDDDDDYTSSDRASEDDHLHEGRHRSIFTLLEWRDYSYTHYCD